MYIQSLDALMIIKLAENLACLFDHRAWTRGTYPYKPLTKREWWLNEGLSLIETERMVSFVCLDGKTDGLLGHAALINKGKFWECGRWAVDPLVCGRGIGESLVRACVDYAESTGTKESYQIRWFVVGCSYYQSFSERICRSLGMTLLGVKPDIYSLPDARWGETLFVWRLASVRKPEGLSRDQIKLGIVGLWPNDQGGWDQIKAESLPSFEVTKMSSPIKGRVAIHTTRETLEFMKG